MPFESLQHELNSCVDHIVKEGKQTAKSKAKAKEEQVAPALVAEVVVAAEPEAPNKKRQTA